MGELLRRILPGVLVEPSRLPKLGPTYLRFVRTVECLVFFPVAPGAQCPTFFLAKFPPRTTAGDAMRQAVQERLAPEANAAQGTEIDTAR